MEGCVYILQSIKNRRYYVGSTQNIAVRFLAHQNGLVKSTKHQRPWLLRFYKKYPSIVCARQIEYRLKKQKSKIFLERIIKDRDILLS